MKNSKDKLSNFGEKVSITDPNTSNKWDQTITHVFAFKGYSEGLEIVLNTFEPDINRKDIFGNTPLHYAAYRGHKDVVTLLLRSNACATLENGEGETADQIATRFGHHEISAMIAQSVDQRAKPKPGPRP